MTTGRINQVAFLTDSAARMGRAQNGGGRRSHEAPNACFRGKQRPRPSYPPCVPHPRDRATTQWANDPGTCGRARDVGHSGRLEVHPAPRPRGVQRRAKTGRSGQWNAFAMGMQHRKPTAAKAGARLGRRLKRLAGDVVAARAGIQHAHTRQSPLTRPLRTQCPSRQANARRPTTHSSVAAGERQQARPSMPR